MMPPYQFKFGIDRSGQIFSSWQARVWVVSLVSGLILAFFEWICRLGRPMAVVLVRFLVRFTQGFRAAVDWETGICNIFSQFGALAKDWQGLFTAAFCFYESNKIFSFCQSNFAGLRVLHEIRWSLVDGLRRYVGFKYAGLTAPEG